jgi:D-alanyl-D-alanine carboxypeptidase
VRRALAVLVLAIGVAAGTAQARVPHAQTKAALAALIKAGAPGAIVLVRNGSSTSVFAQGAARLAPRQPVRRADHFRVGSITKIFVSTVVLQLVAEKRLELTDTVEQHLPGLVPHGDGITLRELLQHTSGLYDYADDRRTFAPYLAGNLAYAWKPRQLVRIAVSHKPLFAPGQTWSYSNTNYLLLGLIVEAVTKDSLADQLQRRIFRPLGLRETRFEPGTHVASPAAHGYYNGIDVTGLSGSTYWAAGALVSTADDVSRFLAALFGGKLLGPDQLREMEQTIPIGGNSYGLGLLEVDTACGAAWGHNGIVAGYSSWAVASRDGKHEAVVLSTTRAFPSSSGFQETLDALAATAFCDR